MLLISFPNRSELGLLLFVTSDRYKNGSLRMRPLDPIVQCERFASVGLNTVYAMSIGSGLLALVQTE